MSAPALSVRGFSTTNITKIYGSNFQERVVTTKKKTISTRNEVLHRKERNEFHYDTFRQTMQYLLFWGQCWGLNPVVGITAKTPSIVRFKYNSFKLGYSVVIATAQLGISSICLINLFSTSISIAGLSFFCFYFSTFLITILSIRTATKWPDLVLELSSANLDVNPNIQRKCGLVFAAFVTIAFVEHSLALIKDVTYVIDCFDSASDLYGGYIQNTFAVLFSAGLPYNLAVGICLQLLNVGCMVNWNYSDVFIILISIYLTSVLEELNKRVLWASKHGLPPSAWRSFREAYTRASRLVRVFDEAINYVIFVSFATSLFFICLQLFNILSNGVKGHLGDCPNHPSGPFNGYEFSIYYIFSLFTVLIRALSVALIAAKVHSESKSILPALYSVPAKDYHDEVQRFIEQVHGDTVSLTGLNFFNMTRDLVLTVAGTIITYELVLLQFKGENMLNTSQLTSTLKKLNATVNKT